MNAPASKVSSAGIVRCAICESTAAGHGLRCVKCGAVLPYCEGCADAGLQYDAFRAHVRACPGAPQTGVLVVGDELLELVRARSVYENPPRYGSSPPAPAMDALQRFVLAGQAAQRAADKAIAAAACVVKLEHSTEERGAVIRELERRSREAIADLQVAVKLGRPRELEEVTRRLDEVTAQTCASLIVLLKIAAAKGGAS